MLLLWKEIKKAPAPGLSNLKRLNLLKHLNREFQRNRLTLNPVRDSSTKNVRRSTGLCHAGTCKCRQRGTTRKIINFFLSMCHAGNKKNITELLYKNSVKKIRIKKNYLFFFIGFAAITGFTGEQHVSVLQHG